MSGLAEVRVQDYREIKASNAIVSVETIEAVGRPTGPATSQPLTGSSLPAARPPSRPSPWTTSVSSHPAHLQLDREVHFPRRHHPVPAGGRRHPRGPHHAAREAEGELRAHYARTLHLWRERFLGQWPRIHAQGFDETFRRMWEFYLAYCEAGFRSGYLGVSQLQMTREPG